MSRISMQAVDAIRDLILSDHLKQGDRLREARLAELTGTSRTPVREALRRLEAEGLIEFEPNRGARVASWSKHNLDEVYALRALLEGFGTNLAASRITDEQVGRLAVLADEMTAFSHAGLTQLDEIARRNDEFHQLILASAANELLTSLLGSIIHSPIVMRTFRGFDHAALNRSMRQHRELVTALDARDGAWASAVMQSHILSARNSHHHR